VARIPYGIHIIIVPPKNFDSSLWFCMKHHFFLVSLKFNAADNNVPIFSDVHVYDDMKLVVREQSKKTITFAQGSMAGIYL
jgi:hypothetical protein